jgi:hypothetical protein
VLFDGDGVCRIRPGHPRQNGRCERMHLTLKEEATRPAGANILQQQGNPTLSLKNSTMNGPMKLSK